jgi:BioD-like phosphotransacetylase family protein
VEALRGRSDPVSVTHHHLWAIFSSLVTFAKKRRTIDPLSLRETSGYFYGIIVFSSLCWFAGFPIEFVKLSTASHSFPGF